MRQITWKPQFGKHGHPEDGESSQLQSQTMFGLGTGLGWWGGVLQSVCDSEATFRVRLESR